MTRAGTLQGHLWQVRWDRRSTAPPDGLPRVLAEIYVPCAHPGAGARYPEALAALAPPSSGYSLACVAVDRPLVPQPPERLARTRRQCLERRERRKHPLFADAFIAESLAARPDYYAGRDSRPEREAALRRERERYAEITARPGVLVVHGTWAEREERP